MKRNDVSSVRNFRSVRIRGRVESGRGWVRGRNENSVRITRVGNSGLLVSERSNVSFLRNDSGIRGRVGKSMQLLTSESLL